MRAQLNSTLIGLTTQTDAGIVVTPQRQCGRLQRLLPRRTFVDTPFRGQLHAKHQSRDLTKPTATLLMYFFYFVHNLISAYSTYQCFTSPTQEKISRRVSNPTDGTV